MENKNLTIWQKLTQTFGPDSLLNQDYPTFKFDKKVLLKTRDKAEFEREKLQAQQTKFLAGHWAKIENNLYQQSKVSNFPSIKLHIFCSPNKLHRFLLWCSIVISWGY